MKLNRQLPIALLLPVIIIGAVDLVFAQQTPAQPKVQSESTTERDRRMMRVNRESIYGTTASPFAHQLEFGRATSKTGRVYLHVFEWPADGRLHVPAWNKAITKAYLLSIPKKSLKFEANVDGVTVHLPTHAIDPVATVVVLETH